MLNWRFFFFVLFGIPTVSLAQIRIQQGEWSKRKAAANHQGFLFADSNSVFAIDFQSNNFLNSNKLLAHRYDKKTQNFIETIDILPTKNENVEQDVVQLFSLQNQFITVSTEKLKDGSKKIVLEKITAAGNHQTRIEMPLSAYDNNLNENFEVLTDKQEKALLVCYNIPPSSEKNQRLALTAYDENLQQKWTDTIDFPEKDKQFLFSDWVFDGQNSVYFTGRHISDLFQPDMELSRLTQNSQFLFGFHHTTGKLREVELSLNQRFINKMKMELDSNRWLIAGTYSSDKTFRLDGVFSLILNLDLEIQQHVLHDFTEQEMKHFTTLSPVDKKKKFSDELVLKSIQILKNGEFALVGEEFRKEWQEPMESRMTANNFTEVYYYQNILVFWFSNKGKFQSVLDVAKHQVSANDKGIYSSFLLSNTSEKLLFFFNDHPKNMEQTDFNKMTKIFSPNKKHYLNCVQITSGGSKVEKNVTNPARNIRIQPQKGGQLLDGNTYFLRRKRGKKALVMVSAE